jgi:hypothetical protein
MAIHQRLLDEATERYDQIKAMVAAKKEGEVVLDENGKSRTFQGLKSEGDRMGEQIAAQEAILKDLEESKKLTPQGIKELEALATDPTLTVNQRAKYQVELDKAIAERKEKIAATVSSIAGSERLKAVMKEDGFDAATIAECNPDVGNAKYSRTPKEYKRRIANAINSIAALEAEGQAELRKAPTVAEKEAVKATYAGRIAEKNIERLEAERGYYSTAPGLKELKADAEDRSVRMSVVERARRYAAYEGAKKRHDAEQNDIRLRKMRRRNILRAYAEAGKDPKAALESFKQTEVSPVSKRKVVPAGLRKEIGKVSKITEADSVAIETAYRASGYTSRNAFNNDIIMRNPTELFQDKTIASLNAESEQFTDGGAHRQPTATVGLRNDSLFVTISRIDAKVLDQRAKSFHMTTSSYMRAMATGIDPRQIQNDRSELTNDTKTAKMEKMMGEIKHVA